jgi:dolichol-phosphate mannosyltransferase
MVQSAVRTEPARRLEAFVARSRPRPDDLARLQVVITPDELPARAAGVSDELFVVPSFALAESLIERGADSARVAVVADQADESWFAGLAALPPGEPVVPPAPYRFGMRLLVILPTYDERQNLARMVRTVQRYLETDILIVDDNSPDGTGLIADELAAASPRVFVLHRAEKQGLGRAYLAGFAWALEQGYERVFEMDCDFSHPPWDLPRLAEASRAADLVIGSRYVPGGNTTGWALSRRLLSRGANFYTRAFLGFGVRDWTAGFRCYDGALLGALDLGSVRSDGYAFQIEMTLRTKRQGGRVRELPIRFVDREAGKSKMSRAIALEAMIRVPRMRLWR